jgi:uncharacterized protein (TIGR02145 family)
MVIKKFFVFIFFIGLTINAQKVSNISFRQEQNTIIVSYELETKTPCKIDLYVSNNSGKTWLGPLKQVKGDVGDKIATGNNSVTWNVLDEFDELRGNKIMFKVFSEPVIINSSNNSIAISNSNIVLPTTLIGGQEWTVKNLDVDHYRNGDEIPQVQNPYEWSKLTTGAWCYYDNDPKNGKIYGKLYNWYAVNDPRGLAPNGYHIPTSKEVDFLLGFLGGSGVAGYKLKESGSKYWNSPNIYVTNTNNSGFSGLPGGYRTGDYGAFEHVKFYGKWWYVFSYSSGSYFSLAEFTNVVSSQAANKSSGFSVRCIKD